MVTNRLPFYIRFTIVVVGIVFCVIIMKEAASLLIPLFSGLLLALLLLPIVKFLERRRFNKIFACVVAVLCFVILFFVVNYLLTIQIIGFVKQLPSTNHRLQDSFKSLEEWVADKFNIGNSDDPGYLSNSLKDMSAGITGMLRKLIVSFGNVIIWTLFICVYAFFILYYRKLLSRFVLTLVQKDCPAEMPVILLESEKVIKSYTAGLLVKVGILLVLNGIVLMALGIKYALMLAIIASILSVIPYLGFFVALALAMLVTYANSDASTAVTVALVMLAIHIIDGVILLPRIVGARMKLNPLITVVAVIVGNIIWGPAGMFLFIPLAAMLKIFFENIASLEAWSILFGEDGKPAKAATAPRNN